MKKKTFVFSLLMIVFFLINPYVISAQKKKYVGRATYYSHKLSGRKMANGHCYKISKLTCAHKTFPLGTKLKVRNLGNGKEVVVEVTDRGPYSKKYMIDLSYEAARRIDLIQDGISMVEVSPYNDTEIPLRDNYADFSDSSMNYELFVPRILPRSLTSISHPNAPSEENKIPHALKVRPDLISFNRIIKADKGNR